MSILRPSRRRLGLKCLSCGRSPARQWTRAWTNPYHQIPGGYGCCEDPRCEENVGYYHAHLWGFFYPPHREIDGIPTFLSLREGGDPEKDGAGE